MKDEFIKRKNELSEYALNSNLSNDAFIYKIINNKTLDFLISKIDNRKTITNTNCLIKKGYLTSNEQFIDFLNNLCLIFDNDFIFLGKYRSSVLEIILNYKKNYKFLLCKNYWGNNDFIPYYKFNIKKYLITGFYSNIKYLFDESENIKKLLDIKKNILINYLGNNKSNKYKYRYEMEKSIKNINNEMDDVAERFSELFNSKRKICNMDYLEIKDVEPNITITDSINEVLKKFYKLTYFDKLDFLIESIYLLNQIKELNKLDINYIINNLLDYKKSI